MFIKKLFEIAVAGGEPHLPDLERRKHQRVHTVFLFARITAGADQGLCRLRNISDTGLQIQTSMELERDAAISIDLSERVTLRTTVAWTGRPFYGLKLHAPIDAGAVLRRLADDYRKGLSRPLRVPVQRKATIYSRQGRQEVSVLDISQCGMKIGCAGPLSVGQPVLIQLDNGMEIPGTVRWSVQGHAGIRLNVAIPISRLESGTAL